MGKYTCKCISPGCDKCFEAEAGNKEEAIKLLFEKGESHNFDFHPELPIISDEHKKKLLFCSLKLLGILVIFLVSFVMYRENV
jgi:hypothetical protein